MSYYHVDGVSGVFATPEAHVQQHAKTWRWLIASFFVLLLLSISGAVVRVFTSVESAQVEIPRITSVAPTPAPAAAPVVLAESKVDPDLQKELEAWTASKSSNWAFYVQALDDGEVWANVNSTKQFQMASIYKLFLLKPLAKKIPAEAWASSNVTDKSYLACVQAMLALSDNPCAEAIAGNLGWTNVHKQNIGDGYKSTVLNDTENFVSTASDTALLLDRLYHGDGYDAKTKAIALDSLAKRKTAEAIRKSCPDCTIYNKTGDLNGYKHDAAIVEKNGKAYVVVIFSSGSTWPQLTEAAGVITSRL